MANPSKLMVEEVMEGLNSLTNRQVDPLLEEIALIGIEDNRKGVLRQIDGEGNRMPNVTYRTGKAQRFARFRQRASDNFGTATGTFKGRTNWKAPSTIKRNLAKGRLPNNNLTTAAYKKLTGPALAPRGEESRVITNHRGEWGRTAKGYFFVRWYWKDVLSAKGRAFLRAHFRGIGRLPRRDLRGIRPESRVKVKAAIWEFVDLMTRPRGR
jgi:hypothetical protein